MSIPRRVRRRQPRPALFVIGGLALLIGVGTVLLALPMAGTGRRLSIAEAAFTAISALTTTGLSIIQPSRDLSLFGQIVLMALMQLGAIGFTVLAITMLRLLGRRITFSERVTLRDALGLIDLNGIVRLTQRVVLGVLLIEALGTILLWLDWGQRYGWADGLYLALFHSISAFCNASFDLFGGGGSAATNPFPSDPYTLVVIGGLIALGSFGIPVIADVLNWRSHPGWTLHTRLSLVVWLLLTVAGTILVFITESHPETAFADVPAGRRLLLAWFHVVASRTSGFNIQPISALAPGSILVLTLLMFIGGAPVSTSGGIRSTTFAVLVLAAVAYVRGADEIRVGKRSIGTEAVQKSVAVLMISLLVIATGAWLLMLTGTATFQVSLFEAVSAFATCGFSLGLTGNLTDAGRLVVALLMIWGRLGPLTLIASIAHARQPSPISYPEERIIIG